MCVSCQLQVDGLQLSSGGRGVNNGAWGVWLKNGADTLVKYFNAQARMVRDVAVQGLQPGTVIVNSKSPRLTQGRVHVGASVGVCRHESRPGKCWTQHAASPPARRNSTAAVGVSCDLRKLQPGWLFRVCAGTGTDLAIQTMAAGPYGLLLSNVDVGYGSRPWAQMGTTQSASSFMTVWNMNGQVKVGWLAEVERGADCYNPAHADSFSKFAHACRHSLSARLC